MTKVSERDILKQPNGNPFIFKVPDVVRSERQLSCRKAGLVCNSNRLRLNQDDKPKPTASVTGASGYKAPQGKTFGGRGMFPPNFRIGVWSERGV